MRLKKRTKRLIQEMDIDRLEQRAWLNAAGSGLMSVAISLFGLLFSYYLTKSRSPKSDILASATTLAFYIGGIVLFAVIIIGIAGIMRRQNRDVTRLTQRLAEIYSIALSNSALNPQPKSTPSND